MDFIADDAIEDAADALAELSHAAALLRGGARGGGSRDSDVHDADPWVRPSRSHSAPRACHLASRAACAQGMGPRAAASVAARGVMFANAHPAPRRFLPLRGPAATGVERAAAEARAEAAVGVAAARGGDACCGGGGASAAAEVLPFLRTLAAALPPAAAHALPPRHSAAAPQQQRRAAAAAPLPQAVERVANAAEDAEHDPVDDSD